MKIKEFRKTDEFKAADIVKYVFKDGTEFDGKSEKLNNRVVLSVNPITIEEYADMKCIEVTIE